jgi:hypothetical protein
MALVGLRLMAEKDDPSKPRFLVLTMVNRFAGGHVEAVVF